MEKRLLALAVLVILLVVWATPVYAFDPPSQPTDNATDVILWYGDNLTIEAAAVTITGFEDAMVAAAEAQAAALVKGQGDITGNYLTLLLVALIVALAFWKQNLFLFLLTVPVSTVYGLTLAADEESGSPIWVAGIIIAIIGTYCLFKVVMMGLERAKERRN